MMCTVQKSDIRRQQFLLWLLVGSDLVFVIVFVFVILFVFVIVYFDVYSVTKGGNSFSNG